MEDDKSIRKICEDSANELSRAFEEVAKSIAETGKDYPGAREIISAFNKHIITLQPKIFQNFFGCFVYTVYICSCATYLKGGSFSLPLSVRLFLCLEVS